MYLKDRRIGTQLADSCRGSAFLPWTGNEMRQRGDRPEHVGRSDGAEQKSCVPRRVRQLPRGQTRPRKHRPEPHLGTPAQGQPGEPTCPSPHAAHRGPGGPGTRRGRLPASFRPAAGLRRRSCPCAHLGRGGPRTKGHRGPSLCAYPSSLLGNRLLRPLDEVEVPGSRGTECPLSVHPSTPSHTAGPHKYRQPQAV